jgi:hypothetical protein
MARRTINRMEKRTEYEVYEASERGKNENEEELEEEEDEEDEEAPAASEDADDEEDAEEPKPKKNKPAKEPKPRSRARTVKVPRLKVVWGVFNNANQCVARYDYPKKHDADQHAFRLREEKKQTFFVQPIKEPIDEKKGDK